MIRLLPLFLLLARLHQRLSKAILAGAFLRHWLNEKGWRAIAAPFLALFRFFGALIRPDRFLSVRAEMVGDGGADAQDERIALLYRIDIIRLNSGIGLCLSVRIVTRFIGVRIPFSYLAGCPRW